MCLADFTDRTEAECWQSIDDAVMGGHSRSAMLAGDDMGVFTGTLSLERGGGFASVRRRDQLVDLSAYHSVELRLRGDGKRYKLNLRTSRDYDGAVYQASFETRPSTWQSVRLNLSAFAPRFRGRSMAGVLDPRRICSLGLLISDRQTGTFRLELSAIKATAYAH